MQDKTHGKTKINDVTIANKSERRPRREDLQFISSAPPIYNLYCFFHNWVNSLLDEKTSQNQNTPNPRS
ncbi:hypothetical protein [Legionella waltersii]|uniref:Uncharacterized protein n=1 Tax=Legionella waltersii TaxID=66969 RepID=A0A0W1A5I6_9GAMM|nr:hypothetical protein [Legionella waltersii]KTD76602.1 hypothetical protein Lwal_2324 [Legionella waltersii]SNU94594.1 Uncharacterised protein [Legionella waltersii]